MAGIELKGLKGLKNLSILGDSADKSSEERLDNEKVEKILIDHLVSSRYQPRKNFDDAALIELVDSVKVNGIIQPLIVRQIEKNVYELIAGERRLLAAKKLGLSFVPAIVRNVEDSVAFVFALIENIQRENLNPVEEALAFARFHDEFSMTHDEIAHMVGKSRATVTNSLRLLSLEPQVMKMLEESKIDMGHARALLSLSFETQLDIAKEIIERQLSVRQAENLIRNKFFLPLQKNNVKHLKDTYDINIWQQKLSLRFGKAARLTINSKGKAKVIIDFNSLNELDIFINKNGSVGGEVS